MGRLKGKRGPQLAELHRRGAFSRETAVPTSMDRTFSSGTLSAMIGEGLTEQAQLPYKGDSRRRTSHYWLTPLGRTIAAVERAIERCEGEGWTVRVKGLRFLVSQGSQRYDFAASELLKFAGV